MNILGVELDFAFCDADQMEIYERENRRVVERVQEKTQYEGKSNAEGFRIQCGIVDDFFDAVFGEGTSNVLFHGKCNLREHMEAFGAVADAAMEARDQLMAIGKRYAPNRAERRLAQKQGKVAAGPGFVSANGYSIMHPAEYAGDPGPKGLPGIADGLRGLTNEPGPTGEPGLRGPSAAASSLPEGMGAAVGACTSITPNQQAFIEKFIQLMPEMDAFMKSCQKQQESGVNC